MIDWNVVFHPSALFGMVLTIVAYAAATSVWRRIGSPPLLHPVLVAAALVSSALLVIGIPYEQYFSQARPLNELLSLVVVMLAVPLYRQFGRIRESGLPIMLALIAGSVFAMATALALPVAAGVGSDLLATLAPKSTTAAVAVEVSQQLGGSMSLTAVIVISTGIVGAVFGPKILDAVDVRDDRAKGFALGVASHALGTARAFQISEVAGAFASLGMILNALLTIVLAPLALAALGG